MNDEAFHHPPDGLSVERGGADVFAIQFRPTGMGCMRLFLLVWLTGWTAFCGLLVYYLIENIIIGDWEKFWLSLLFVAVFGFFECFVLYSYAIIFMVRKRLLFNEQCLVVESTILVWTKTEIVDRREIHEVVQVKDGGEDDDSFPSWGLQLRANQEISLIARQPHEKSLWLGRMIAEWCGAPWRAVPAD